MSDWPECLDGTEPCLVCSYGDPSWCPLIGDNDYRAFLMLRRDTFHQQESAAENLRKQLVDVLRRNRLPLHYEVVHRIIADGLDGPVPSPRAIYAVLSRDPNVEAVEPGVYRYRRSR
jgi:hypothetical protein